MREVRKGRRLEHEKGLAGGAWEDLGERKFGLLKVTHKKDNWKSLHLLPGNKMVDKEIEMPDLK